VDDQRLDEELLGLARRGDPDAFCAFYDRRARVLLSWLCREVGNPEVAVDLTAEAFAQGLRSLRRFRGETPGSGRAWLYAIARHLLARYRDVGRRETEARRKLSIPIESSYDAVDWTGGLDGVASEAYIKTALEGLPDEQRAAVRLRVIEELAYDEIATRLGCTSGAARTRVSRGLRTLYAQLQGEPR
jgi:RNA polymerase sigma factor (sigma-70 family)